MGTHNRLTLEIRVGERVKIGFLEEMLSKQEMQKKDFQEV